jgi:hypothetical protein
MEEAVTAWKLARFDHSLRAVSLSHTVADRLCCGCQKESQRDWNDRQVRVSVETHGNGDEARCQTRAATFWTYKKSLDHLGRANRHHPVCRATTSYHSRHPYFPRGDAPAVICPICEQRVSLKSINKHIDDNCRPKPPPTSSDPPQLSSKSQWSKIMGSGRKSKGKDKYTSTFPFPRGSSLDIP